MALSSKAGTFAQPISTTGHQSITGVGFLPKVLLFWASGVTADVTNTAHASLTSGFAVSSSDQRSVAATARDAVSAPQTGKRNSVTDCIMFLDPTSATQVALAKADFISMDADGFTVNWSTCDAPPRIVHYLALGGTDVVNVQGGVTVTPGATTPPANTVAVSTGFTPDAVLFLHGSLTGSPANSNNAGFAFGFAAKGSGQAAIAGNSLSGASPTVTTRYQRTDRGVAATGFTGSTGNVGTQATVQSFDATGFTLAYDISPSGGFAQSIYWLAIQGPQCVVDTVAAPTGSGGTAVQSVRSLPFQPGALLLASDGSDVDTGPRTVHRFTLGAATGTGGGAQSSVSFGDNNAQTTSQAKSYSDAAKIYSLVNVDGSTTVIAQLTALVSTGFDLTWSNLDAGTHLVPYLAFGPAAAVINPDSLVLSGATSGLSGATSGPLLLSMHPSNASIASGSQRLVTLSVDGYPGVTFSPGATLTLSHDTPAALFDLVLPTITGTTPQDITLRVQSSGLSDLLYTITVYPAATGIALSGPPTGTAGELSDVFTVSLSGGAGVDGEIPATPTITGGTGYAVPAVVLLSNATPTATFRVVVEGVATVDVGLANTDPLPAPPTVTYSTTLAADYTLSAPLTVPAGYRTGRIRIALRDGLVLTNPLHVALGDDQQSGQQGTWYLDLDSAPITSVTLEQTARSVDVQYQAAAGLGVGATITTVQLSLLGDQPSLQEPAAAAVDVYDGAVYYAVTIAGDYPGFPGFAATMTYQVLDDSQVLVYDNPTGRVWAADSDGKYASTIVVRQDSGGSVTWSKPPSYSGGAAQYEFNRAQAVGPVLGTTDLGAVQTAASAAMLALTYTDIGDVPSLAAAQASPWKALLFVLQYLINSVQDSSGNLKVKNTAGTVISNGAGHNTTQTLKVTSVSGVTQVAPGTDS